MFLLTKPITDQWLLVSKPGQILFTYCDNINSVQTSKTFAFHYQNCEQLFRFLQRAVDLLKNNNKTDSFEEQTGEKTFCGVDSGQIYFRNAEDFKFLFQDELWFYALISGVVDIFPSVILPNKEETQYFLDNIFDTKSFFYNTHRDFIKYWQLIRVLSNHY